MLLSRYLSNRKSNGESCVVPNSVRKGHRFLYRISGSDWPASRWPIIVEPPFSCIEVLSPSDRMKEMQERIDDYLAFGVRYVWLLHPRTRRAFVYTVDAVREVKDGVLRTDDPDICVPLAELE